MRPGQHNNNSNKQNRGRSRNRRHGGGGHTGGGGGGSSSNRVLDSNGPDVKLRGTAQTIAEKYMQMGRDAQASGDPVMSESYYQHADHYYRLWLAMQPVGQPLQFSRRLTEEELEDDAADGDGDDEGASPESAVPGNGEAADGVPQAERPAEAGEAAASQGEGQHQNRQFRQRDNREGGRERFRPRWPRRSGGERNYESRDGVGNGPIAEGQAESGEPQLERQTNRDRTAADTRGETANDQGNWEAPSFLTRPTPVVVDDDDDAKPTATEIERRPRGRRARGEDAAPESVESAPGPSGGEE